MARRELTPEETKLAIEHRDVLLAVRAVLNTPSGKTFLKYILKSLSANQSPEQGLEGNALHDRLGVIRAGNSIFKIACEASAQITAALVCEIEQELYAELYSEQNIGPS